MVTTLYLIRHGGTEGADAERYKGHIDVPLSEKGIQQMERLAEYISAEATSKLSAVYCSDLVRAVKSAEIIAGPYSIEPVAVKAFRERNFGIWEGMSFDEIKEKYPEEFNAWANNPLEFSPMQGENTLEVRDRAINALDEILKHPVFVGRGSGGKVKAGIQDTGRNRLVPRYRIVKIMNHASCIVNLITLQ